MNISKIKTKNKLGFTVIEILVVIAVIAILAAIVAVSVTGIMKKNRNAKRLTDIKNYATAIEMAYVQNGEYPDPGEIKWYCLGDYPDDNCGYGSYHEDITEPRLNDIISDYIGMPIDNFLIDGYCKGYFYRCNSRPANVCTTMTIAWCLEGPNQSCGIGTFIDNHLNVTRCSYSRAGL